MLLLVFAYGGFETALAPMSEAKNPRRDAPFALFTALLACTVIYALIQRVVVGVLPNAVQSQRPLADVARLAVGPFGAALVAIGALISFYGYLSAKILAMPRVPFALAEQGDFPKVFAAIHRRFHTPYVSILVFAGMVWGLALFGDLQMERDSLCGSAVALLRGRVRCAANIAAQATRRRECDVPSTSWEFSCRTRSDIVRDSCDARGFRPVRNSDRDNCAGGSELGTGGTQARRWMMCTNSA